MRMQTLLNLIIISLKNLDRFHEVELQVTVETNGEEHIQSIIDTFKKNGYTIKRLNSSEILSE